MSEEFVVQLANNKLFEALKEGELAALASIATPVYFKKGQDVFIEGDTGDSFYQIIEGSVSIIKNDDKDASHEIAVLRENEILGEMALLSDFPRSATAKCLADVQLLRILKDDFTAMLDAGNTNAITVLRHMSKVLCSRLREMNNIMSGLLKKETVKGTPELAALREKLMKEWSF